MRIICISFFFSTLDTFILVHWVLWPLDIHCTYIWFIYILMHIISPISPCVVSFLSLYTFFLFDVCNLIFLFHTKMHWWVLFKVFQKNRLSKSTCHKLPSCKNFQEFMLGKILLYLTSEYELSIYDFSHMFICLLWFCHGLPKREIVRTYVIQC